MSAESVNMDPEECYMNLTRVIEDVNVLINTYADKTFAKAFGKAHNADKGCIRCGCADGCFRFGAPIGHCSRSRRLVRIALAGINSVGCRGK